MSASLADRAREIVGAEHLLVAPQAVAAYAVDGVVPTAVARPGTPEETGALLAAAGDTGAAVLPWGAGAHQHLGQVPSRADLVVDTARLTGITDYTPADYVVAVRAGTRFRDLQAELAKHNQWLPIDPPGAGRATLGGLIAANRNGPRRLLWGSIRDMLIGIRVALPTGEVIKAGGKVVKNVAGYDLGKLFIGSLGAAGIVTEATFKISPMPGDGLTVLVAVPDLEAAHALTTAVMRSYLLPSALEAVNPPAFRRLAGATGAPAPSAGAWGVLLLVEGMEESRARHVSEMRSLGGAAGRVEILEGDAHRGLWDAVAEFPSPDTHPGGVVCRAGGPIARWSDLARALEPLGDDGRAAEIVAHAGVGLLYAAAAADAGTALVEALGRAAGAAGGYAVVETAPPALKPRLPVWGAEPGGIALMRRLRAAYDPRGIMVPGRLGWGLS
ncbi:MAG TPA: FAD-binding oxidoreductase [bacterium]|nr:FAD-binding oxidoreductase [bacterium]